MAMVSKRMVAKVRMGVLKKLLVLLCLEEFRSQLCCVILFNLSSEGRAVLKTVV